MIQHVTSPTITGGATIGLKYNGGVLLASDTQLVYGGYLMEKNQSRTYQISDNCAMVSSGEYADFTEVCKLLKHKRDADLIADDGFQFLEPQDYCTWLARMQYQKRNKMKPFYNNHIVGGVDSKGEVFLGNVDIHGNTFQNNDYLVNGMAHYFCNVLLTNAGKAEDLSEADARKVLENCFTTMFMRDKTCSQYIQITKVTTEGVEIGEAQKVDSHWDHKNFKEYTNEHARDIRFYM